MICRQNVSAPFVSRVSCLVLGNENASCLEAMTRRDVRGGRETSIGGTGAEGPVGTAALSQ